MPSVGRGVFKGLAVGVGVAVFVDVFEGVVVGVLVAVFDGVNVGVWVAVFVEVEGAGDYFPPYAGNLDIMTAAAARTAEMFAEEILAGSLTLERVTA